MKVLIIEDDHQQSEFIAKTIEEKFFDVEIDIINTELEFLTKISELETNHPDLIVTDVMLRWTDPTQQLKLFSPLPKEFEEEDSYRAGFRCIKLIQNKESLSKIPIIIYSVLDRDEIAEYLSEKPSHIIYLQKDFDSNKLEKQIRSLIIVEGSLPLEKNQNFLNTTFDSIEAKPGGMGFSFDLKKYFKKLTKK